ncbi:hypothetical protein J6590_008861 [Homalodisca vitripennis]|nr:hypothetical protein J6590_008861 [Homalodisca vitripennis]
MKRLATGRVTFVPFRAIAVTALTRDEVFHQIARAARRVLKIYLCIIWHCRRSRGFPEKVWRLNSVHVSAIKAVSPALPSLQRRCKATLSQQYSAAQRRLASPRFAPDTVYGIIRPAAHSSKIILQSPLSFFTL